MKEIAAADGARALLHGSYGRLVARMPRNKKQLWIAGGIGITPFMAMAEDMGLHPERYEDYEVRLIVGVDHRDQAFELERLRDYERRCDGLEVSLWDRSKRGLPTAETIEEGIPDVAERAIMISGPDPMISDLREQFHALGIPRGQVQVERQIGPPKNWRKASPALRRARAATTVFFASFVALVVVSVVSRALFA
jgi:predicted ferric reductase